MENFGATWLAIMARCSGCGLCLPVCPVYAETGREADSPRGQLALAKGLARRQIQPEAAGDYLSHCLLCGRCARVCPAQIPLEELFFAVRRLLRLPFPIFWRRLSHAVALRPKAVDFLQPPLALAQALVSGRGRGNSPALARLPYAPLAAPEPQDGARPQVREVLFFPGCIARRFYPRLAELCVEALSQCGYNVVSLPHLPCCGRPLAAQGQDIIALARRWLQILADRSFAYLVTPCPGCLDSFIRLWPSLPNLTEEERIQIAAFAGRWRNVLELTANLKGWHGNARIFWHRPCLETDASEESALTLLRDYEIRLSGSGNSCCGAALRCLPAARGNNGGDKRQIAVEQWRGERLAPMSRVLPQRILRLARTCGASLIATSCPGCKLILNNVKMTGGAPIAARHPLEILLERPAGGREPG